jgi:amidophosphoribosyltransferase
MCGISGVVLQKKPLSSSKIIDLLHGSISQIQHRGYDGCGIATIEKEQIQLRKRKGMIAPFFADLSTNGYSTQAQIGIAHTRYKTVGPCSDSATQPLLNQDQTICLAHNGQIQADDHHPDSTYILKYLNQRISQLANSNRSPSILINGIFYLVDQLFDQLQGSYSCLLLIHGIGLVAFRDPHGIRPLCLGSNQNGDYLVASESVCITQSPKQYGFRFVRDLLPGECLIIQPDSPLISKTFRPFNTFTPCVFEYIYLASPRSVIDQLSVTTARQALGRLLAQHMIEQHADLDIDLIVPIPESSCLAAEQLAHELNIKYHHLLELNTRRQKARSFILPTQAEREAAVAEKFLVPEGYDLHGGNLLLVDDSIVRGTTLRHVIQSIRTKCRNVGRVYVASIAPPIKDKNSFGIDIPNTELLIAYQRTPEQVAEHLKADRVIYQDLTKMLEMFAHISPLANHFEHSMFLENN